MKSLSEFAGGRYRHGQLALSASYRLLGPAITAANSIAKEVKSGGQGLETHLTPSEIEEFAATFSSALGLRAQEQPDNSSVNGELRKHVETLVSPKNVDNYISPVGAIRLFSYEISDVGMRIQRYQYIGIYKKFFSPPTPDVGQAFDNHMHDMRPGELYIILERGTTLLRFASLVAQKLNLAGKDQSKSFEKIFKKRLERRLRERHRIVHAHEHPSLTSRIGQLPAPRSEEERKIIGAVLADLVAKAAEQIAALRGVETSEVAESLFKGEMHAIHEKAFEDDARHMWTALVDHLTSTFEVAPTP